MKILGIRTFLELHQMLINFFLALGIKQEENPKISISDL